jgi:hypothetical protein
VTNEGGRGHTFTEVAAFGGGMVPPLNKGLTQAPECLNSSIIAATSLAPGASLELRDLATGNHLFQCCIHPWMRTQVKVEEKHEQESSLIQWHELETGERGSAGLAPRRLPQ